MSKTVDQTEPDTTHSAPQVPDVQAEVPQPFQEPVAAPSRSSQLHRSGPLPAGSASTRARGMNELQRTIGNARAGMKMAPVQMKPALDSQGSERSANQVKRTMEDHGTIAHPDSTSAGEPPKAGHQDGAKKVQAKLSVSSPGDVHEQEADRVAEKVTQKGQKSGPVARVSRIPANGGIAAADRDAPGNAEAGGAQGGVASGIENRIKSPSGGQPLPEKMRRQMESGLGADFSGVRVHDSAADKADADRLNAKAFTHGSDIWIGSKGSADDPKLMAHELSHTIQQSKEGGTGQSKTPQGNGQDDKKTLKSESTRARQTNSSPTEIQRTNGGGSSNLQRLDELLEARNVPEEEVITLLGQLTAEEKAAVLSGGYQARIAGALSIGEMVRAVNNLNPELATKLRWVESAARVRSSIDYSDIKSMVTSAPQAERDALKTVRWRGFFVDVCSNETIIGAVNDLAFDLTTKLEWVEDEVLLKNLDYSEIKSMVISARQAERDALKTIRWRDFFVGVCDNKTIIEAVNDLGFDLITKLEWVEEEVALKNLDYSEIKSMVNAAPQAERDRLKTVRWRDFFVGVCNDDTMAEAIDDLHFDLVTKLDWTIEEGTAYLLVKPRITSAAAADRAAVLADQTLLGRLKDELGWNDFAKCVELLGRQALAAGPLLADPTVQAAMAAAWAASNPAVPGPGTTQHEEGGWIYMNLITGAITVTTQNAGASAAIDLSSPATVDDCVVVGYFHTHPNLGPGWNPRPSGRDVTNVGPRGVPAYVRSGIGDFTYGPASRLHLAGSQGFPGRSGGESPQAKNDETFDEE